MERSAVSVAIVGGGITGLSTAYYLERIAREEGWDLTGVLVEQDSRLGGKLLTHAEDGFIVEGGPDSFLVQKPQALQMIKELGMENHLVTPQARDVFLLYGGRLHSIPEGLVGAVPTQPLALWKASFLSLKGKIRASLEPFIRRRNVEQESLGAFLRRRLGSEVSQRLAEPFTAGIYAGDARQLGLRYLFPTLAEWEDRYGSLTRGIYATRSRSGDVPPASPFNSLRSGMASLPQSVGDSLRDFTVTRGKRVIGLAGNRDGLRPRFRLSQSGGESIMANYVVLAIPAHEAAILVRPITYEAAELLGQLPFASTASVSLAFRREAVAHSLNGSGFLVPRSETCPVTGCTWMTSKWPGRIPHGWVLLRAFVGWAREDSFMEQDDPAVVRQVTEALRPLLGLRGESERAWVDRWPQAMPQYVVGHQVWLDALEEALDSCPGLLLAGASYQGIGVPDCIRQGREAALNIRQLVARGTVVASQGPPVSETGSSL